MSQFITLKFHVRKSSQIIKTLDALGHFCHATKCPTQKKYEKEETSIHDALIQFFTIIAIINHHKHSQILVNFFFVSKFIYLFMFALTLNVQFTSLIIEIFLFFYFPHNHNFYSFI